MERDKQCPFLPECIIKADRCVKHQWFSSTRLSHLAQESLLTLDLQIISDDDLDAFVEQKLKEKLGNTATTLDIN